LCRTLGLPYFDQGRSRCLYTTIAPVFHDDLGEPHLLGPHEILEMILVVLLHIGVFDALGIHLRIDLFLQHAVHHVTLHRRVAVVAQPASLLVERLGLDQALEHFLLLFGLRIVVHEVLGVAEEGDLRLQVVGGDGTIAHTSQNHRTVPWGPMVAAEGERQGEGKTEVEWSHGCA